MQQRSEETRARIIESASKFFSNRGYNAASVDEGSFVEVNPDLASRMILSTAIGLFLQSLLDPQGTKWEKVARDSTTLLLNSLLKQGKETETRRRK